MARLSEALANHTDVKQSLDRVVDCAAQVVLGKKDTIRLALTCLVARGHLLIEDVPGVGKTTLAHVLAQSLGLRFNRIQFTSDLLPADVLGASIYQRDTGRFEFHPGPIFAQVVLADEINRATPKTQSCLLEAMEEQQVSIDGESYPLPEPFFVIATQNPAHLIGTFPLPESQLDRFLMRIEMGFPDPAAERVLLKGRDRRDLLADLQPCMSLAELKVAQRTAEQVHVSEALLDYVQALLARSRSSAHIAEGLSPRAGLALLRSSRAWALVQGREQVLPEDVQAMLPAVAGHRLRSAGPDHPQTSQRLIERLVESVPIP